jgi:hypothetical protein
MVHESFQFLRRRWSSGLAQDSARDKQILLYYFFNRCDALGKLVRAFVDLLDKNLGKLDGKKQYKIM